MPEVVGIDAASEGALVALDLETGRALFGVRWFKLDQRGQKFFEIKSSDGRRLRVEATTRMLGLALREHIDQRQKVRAIGIEKPSTGRGPKFNFQTTVNLCLRVGGLAVLVERDHVAATFIEPNDWRDEVMGIRKRGLKREEVKRLAIWGGDHGVPDGGICELIPGLREVALSLASDAPAAIDVLEAGGVAACARLRLLRG